MDGGMKSCDHDWEDTTRYAILKTMGYQRRCKKCWRRETWDLREAPSPTNTGWQLGEWAKSMEWTEVYEKYWSGNAD